MQELSFIDIFTSYINTNKSNCEDISQAIIHQTQRINLATMLYWRYSLIDVQFEKGSWSQGQMIFISCESTIINMKVEFNAILIAFTYYLHY